jgi:hypothetical protein
MAHFAELDENNIVVAVRPGPDSDSEEAIFERTGIVHKRCSYNTNNGKHRLGGTPFRKNYPGPGYIYDEDRDAFIPPKVHASWILDEEQCVYLPPEGKEAPDETTAVGSPTEIKWSEDKQEWVSLDFSGNPYTWDRSINKWRVD